LEESVSLGRQIADQFLISSALNTLGLVAFHEGDYERAWALYEEVLALGRQAGDQWRIGAALHNMGEVAEYQKDYERSKTLHKQSLEVLCALGDKTGIVVCLEGLAAVARGQCQPVRAARLYGAAEGLREAIGSPLSPAYREAYDKHLAALRTALGDRAFTAARTAGRCLPCEQAVEYALSEQG
jgi:tetratricopeptide (TPR) repeat protein